MINPLPRHPYRAGTPVHDAAELRCELQMHGSAEVVDARPQPDGTHLYTVRIKDGGDLRSWPSYFTIPAGLWNRPGPEKPAPRGALRSPRIRPHIRRFPPRARPAPRTSAKSAPAHASRQGVPAPAPTATGRAEPVPPAPAVPAARRLTAAAAG